MISLSQLFNRKEMAYYFVVGVVATAIDWGTFAIAVKSFDIDYPIALTCAYSLAAIFHYFSNKFFTFNCQSKKFGSQILTYILVTGASLGCSIIILGLLVKTFAISTVILRMVTTGFMLVPNYLLHKHITYKKKSLIPAPLSH